jgi:hypothetical protein
MAWTVRLSACVVLLLSGVTAAVAQSPDVLAAVGQAIAADLDFTNGAPIVVVAGYAEGGQRDVHQDPTTSTALASAFAEARGIPLIDAPEGGTRCSWAPAPGDGPLGLWAQFYPPELTGDTVRVALSGRCLAQRTTGLIAGFRQVHLFVVAKRETGAWEVVERQLMSIT